MWNLKIKSNNSKKMHHREQSRIARDLDNNGVVWCGRYNQPKDVLSNLGNIAQYFLLIKLGVDS